MKMEDFGVVGALTGSYVIYHILNARLLEKINLQIDA